MTDDKIDDMNDPAEDFADFDDGFEEEIGATEEFDDSEEFVEEEWDSFDQDDGGEFSDEGGKKKSSMIFNVVIGLVVLGGLGFAGMKFLGGGGDAGLPVDVAAEQQPLSEENAVASYGDGSSPVDTGALAANDSAPMPNNLVPPPSDPEVDFDIPMPFSNANMDEGDVSDVASADNGGENTLTPVESDPLTPLPVPNDSEQGNDTYDDGYNAFETQATNELSETDVVDSSTQNAFETQTNSVSSVEGGDDLQAIAFKLDELFNRLDQIENEIGEIKQGNGGSADNSDLKASIARLEKKVASLSNKPASSSNNSGSSRAVSTAPRASATATVKAHSTVKWALKSAQPGRATIAKLGTDDVISVSVGDVVAGLGKVTSVNVKDGKWVVQATGGSVSQ